MIAMNEDTYIIIPAYNEGSAVRPVIKQVQAFYSHIVCIDDGSKDDTATEIAKTKAHLVRHPINLGQGAALQTGIEFALQDKDAKYFVTFDSDGQHSLDDVAHMLEVIKKENLDIVLGSRFLGKTENITATKKVILKLAILFTNRTSGLKLTDTHNGLRVFNRATAEKLNIANPDFSHASEIIDKIAAFKLRYKEVPVTIKYTDYSKQKGQSIFNAVNMGLDLLFDRFTKR